MVYEATYSNIINLGSNLAAALELLQDRSPLLHGQDHTLQKSLLTIDDNSTHVSGRRINTMLRSKIRGAPQSKLATKYIFGATMRDGLELPR